MLVIPMHIVCNLGEGRYQLRCLCNTAFTFAPIEKINTNPEGEAECPTCRSKWDGEVSDEDNVDLTLKYFNLAVRVKNAKGNSDEFIVVAVGRGVDIQHFAVPAIVNLCNKIPTTRVEGFTIREITCEEFEKVNDSHQGMLLGLYEMLKSMMRID